MKSKTNYRIYFEQQAGRVVYVELTPQGGESDVWRDIAAYDDQHGTRYYDLLDEGSILDVGESGDGCYAGRADRADDDMAGGR